MSRRHGIHVINLTVRCASIVIWSAIPTRRSGLCENRFGSGWNFYFLGLLWPRGNRLALFCGRGHRWRRWKLLRHFVPATTEQEDCSEKDNKKKKVGHAP